VHIRLKEAQARLDITGDRRDIIYYANTNNPNNRSHNYGNGNISISQQREQMETLESRLGQREKELRQRDRELRTLRDTTQRREDTLVMEVKKLNDELKIKEGETKQLQMVMERKETECNLVQSRTGQHLAVAEMRLSHKVIFASFIGKHRSSSV
jgi:predicted  nucleic acid-binding Zn-ribbon protein